jgi:DNA-binding XRE family transcriptional regulator
MAENKAKAARTAAGLSAREAAELVGVSTITWQVWEGQTKRKTEIPLPTLEYFKLVTDTHPTLVLSKRRGQASADA